MKISDPLYPEYGVYRVGSAAASTLARAGQGKVAAVFDRSFYCVMEDEYVCVGTESLGMCPLNVITSIPEGSAWSSHGFRAGMPVNVARDHMRIGGCFSLKLSGIPVWKPPPPVDPQYQKVKEGLDALEEFTASRLPMDGLGRLMGSVGPGNRFNGYLLNYAIDSLNSLKDWLKVVFIDPHECEIPDPSSWQELLGLGPGLTPSGDDLIGGMMLALHSLGKEAVLRSLSAAVAPIVNDRTNPISAAHLRAAMEGMGSEAAHKAMDAILSGSRGGFSEIVKEIEKIGHTSGWDMLTGIVIVYRLWVQTADHRHPAQNS